MVGPLRANAETLKILMTHQTPALVARIKIGVRPITRRSVSSPNAYATKAVCTPVAAFVLSRFLFPIHNSVKMKFGNLALKKDLVLRTWSGLLMNEDALPDDWTYTVGVLVGIQPLTLNDSRNGIG